MWVENKTKIFWDQPCQPTINKNDLEIWRIPVTIFSKLYASYAWVLSMEEYNQANRFYKLIDFQNYVNGKIGTRLLLAHYLKCTPSELSYVNNEFSKPYLASHPNLHFNISKSEEWVIIALSRSEIGVDIEKVSTDAIHTSMIDEVFTKSEIVYMNSISSLSSTRFYYLWTRKESYLKQISTGINRYLNSFSVLQPTIMNKENVLKLDSLLLNTNYYISICYPEYLRNISFYDLNTSFLAKNIPVLR